MDELPFAELVFDDDEVRGVRCPVCQTVLPTTDPMRAAEIYGAHYRQEHAHGEGQ